MGFTEDCFTRSDEEMIAEAFDWSAPAMEGITLESLRQSGLGAAQPSRRRTSTPRTPRATSRPRRARPSSVPRWPQQAGNFVVPLFRQGSNEYQPGRTVDPLPHYVPPRETARDTATG